MDIALGAIWICVIVLEVLVFLSAKRRRKQLHDHILHLDALMDNLNQLQPEYYPDEEEDKPPYNGFED